VYYALGYSYYYIQKWTEAIHSFKNFVAQKNLNDKDVYSIDATTRLADLYYVTRQFPAAISNYEKVKKIQDNDEYVLFQLATIYYLTNRTEFAKAHYTELIKDYPSSNYLSNCYMQLGQIDLENSNYTDAIIQYSKVIKLPIDEKGFKPLAYQKRAMCYFNLKQYDQALADNNVLLKDYTTSEEAYSALLNTQQIFTIQERTDDFEPILENYKAQNPDGQDLREVEYTTSKSLYGNEKYEKAISGFQNLLQKYPNHPNKMEIEYYLADSYFKLKNWDKAIEYYTLVYLQKNTYYKKSLQRLAEANVNIKSYRASFNYWKELQTIATSSKDKTNSMLGMMLSQYELAGYDSCIYYAQQLIDMGKSYYQKNDLQNAEDHFLICLNGAKDIHAAEAHFMLAQIQRDKGDYIKSNQTLYDFNNDYYNYDYWYGRSFLLLADNFISMKENFQAQETLESVVKGSKNTEIVELAKQKLASMKTNENAPDGTSNE
jgi:tetratricopeptide (TPR) repeat protein